MTANCLSLLKRVDSRLCIYVFCVFLPFLLSPLAASSDKESRCGYVMLLMAGYWMLEPVPVAATALLPVVLFPALGVVGSNEICQNYMKESFMMFIGGLIVAVAVEDCRLHERIALKVLMLVGSEMKWLMFGFMCTTMVLSMWVSNTATTAMMVPIVEAVVRKISSKVATNEIEMGEKDDSLTESKQRVIPESEGDDHEENADVESSTLKTALLLCVCYAANIGGTGTLTGTGPNLVLVGFMDDLHPGSNDISFATWMMYNVPGMLLCMIIGWFYLWMIYVRCSKTNHNLESSKNIKKIISDKYAELGSISVHETQVLVLFVILVILWIFREPKFIMGWSDIIGSDMEMKDSVPAILIAFLLFFLPADPRNPGGRPILEWKTAQAKLPWGVIILIGGGFALANGTQKSGLSRLVGNQLTVLQGLPSGAIVTIVCFMTAMLTEIVSNTTTATILLPVFSQMAVSIGVNPLYMMLPVAVVCSYAFMLPVATPPNAIAFDSGKMRTLDMAKPGLAMNLICCGVQLLMLNTLGVAMFDLNNFPSWAQMSNSSFISNLTLIDNSFNISVNGT